MELENRLKLLEDKFAIQELTNSYLAAADRKDHVAMSAHFTPKGSLTSIMPDVTITLENTQGIADGFAKILAPIEAAYHMAGQIQIVLNGTEATGTSYSFVTLIGNESDQKYVRKIWAVYNDEYVKENDKWLINKRLATVSWEEKEIL